MFDHFFGPFTGDLGEGETSTHINVLNEDTSSVFIFFILSALPTKDFHDLKVGG